MREVLSYLLIINCVGTVFKDGTMLEKYLLIVEGNLYSDTTTGLRSQVTMRIGYRWER